MGRASIGRPPAQGTPPSRAARQQGNPYGKEERCPEEKSPKKGRGEEQERLCKERLSRKDGAAHRGKSPQKKGGTKCRRDSAGKTVRERQCRKDGAGETVWERRCGRDGAGKTMRERRCGRDGAGETVQERRCRKDGAGKTVQHDGKKQNRPSPEQEPRPPRRTTTSLENLGSAGKS